MDFDFLLDAMWRGNVAAGTYPDFIQTRDSEDERAHEQRWEKEKEQIAKNGRQEGQP